MSKTAQFTIISDVQTTFEHTQGATTSQVVECQIHFDMKEPGPDRVFSKKGYVNADGVINSQEGLKAQAANLVNGLLAGIHQGHQQGLWDSAEHLRWIIGHLENGFVAQAKVTTGKMGGE